MKLALLQGNRFTPWHLAAFQRLEGAPAVAAFRAESEIQRHFQAQGADTLGFPVEPIYFDTQAGPWAARQRNRLLARWGGHEPRILPFAERLRDYDLIQSWELFTDWSREAVEARRRCGIPLSVMVWDNIPFNMERNPERRAIKQSVAEWADRLLVHTERSRRMLLLEGVDVAKIERIDPGVDTVLFSPGPADRASWGVLPEDFVILFVGWFLPRKGIDFLLLAMRELLSSAVADGRRIRLVMAGAGPGRDRAEALVRRLCLEDACVFAGSRPYGEMPGLFRMADVFVLPSIATEEWQEQFGMSMIEAMACGTPVISTFSGAIPEIAGEAALLCQPNDFVSIHEALLRVIQEPELGRELGRRGRARALELFTLDQYAANLSRVYRGMLAEKQTKKRGDRRQP